MSKGQKTKSMTGYAVRQDWLKSLEVGQEILVHRPAYDNKCSSFTRTTRPSIVASGKITERNRVSVTVEWADSVDNRLVLRSVKVGTTRANGVYQKSVIDYRDPSFGLCLFPDYASFRQHEAVLARVRDAFQNGAGFIMGLSSNELTVTQRVKVGTTLSEIDDFLRAASVCF